MKNNIKKYIKTRRDGIIFFCLFLLSFLAVNSFSAEIIVKENVESISEKLFLSDFIITSNAAILARAEEISMGYAPFDLEPKKVKGEYIKTKLKQLKVVNLEEVVIPAEIVIKKRVDISRQEQKTEQIRIKKLVRVSSLKMFLSDFIESGPDEIIEKASAVQIGFSPNPGEEKVMDGEQIKTKFRQIKIQENFIAVPKEIIVLREYQTIEKKLLATIILGKVKENYKEENYSINIEIPQEKEKIYIPQGIYDVQFSDDRLSKMTLGKLTVATSILVDGEMVKKINVNFEIGKIEKNYVLTKDVLRGEQFNTGFTEEKEKIVFSESSSKGNINPLFYVGKLFKRNMKSGESIRDTDFEKKKIFKKGDTVQVVLEYNGILLRAEAKALQDGFEGESCSLINEKSKKNISGIVSSDGTVKIELK